MIVGGQAQVLGIFPLWSTNQYQSRSNFSDTMYVRLLQRDGVWHNLTIWLSFFLFRWSSLRSNLTDPVSGLCPLIPEYQNITEQIELVDYSEDAWYVVTHTRFDISLFFFG